MKPSPQAIVSELDWIFLYQDANPLFHHAAELIKELFIENELLRTGQVVNREERSFGVVSKWSE